MINISNKKHIPVLCLMFFVFCSFCLGSVSYSTPVSAYSASLTTDSSVELNVSHLGDGTDIEAKSLRIVSDCRAGYNLSVATSQNNSLYLNGDGTSSASFSGVDGTSALNSSNNINKWGFTLTNNATSATVFSPLSTTESILKTPSQTVSPSSDIDDTFPIYYGVKVNNTVAPGTYQMANNGEIVYYLTMEASCVAYTVVFNANGGTGTVANQSITAGTPTKLSSANTLVAPTGSSYTDAGNNTITGQADKLWTFWGWNTEIDGSGDWYKDREEVTDLTTGGSTITLYAQWKQATLADLIPDPNPSPSNPKTIDHDTMQDMSTAACFNSVKFTTIGTPYGQATLKDSRDGTTRTYTVAKLPDGLCWMTQNLNLGASSAITLTSDDTDLADGTTFTLPASDPNDFTADTTQAIINKATVLNNMTVLDYTEGGTTYSGKINAYYSYAAATADTSTYSKTTNGMEISTSICPKNWDLPTSLQYYTLGKKGDINTYNSSSYVGHNAGNEPYYFIYGGYRAAAGSEMDLSTFTAYDSAGLLWTSSNSSATQARASAIDYEGLWSPINGNNSRTKYNGLSIRCVAGMDEASHTITYTNTNGGATQTQKIVMGESNELQPTTTWTRTNYRLVGWDTNSAGTNVVYTTGQSITPNSDMTLYTVWKPTYTIQYNGNGADAGVMTNVKHINVKEGDVFDLYASNFSKVNYGFAGWSFDQNAQPGGSSRIYGPNEAITAPAPSTPGETKTLYAIWVASSGNLQGWNNCPNMNNGDVIALKDTRDDNVYTVGKLADGNCWMMENLRLNTAGSSDSTKAQGFGTGFIGLADPETANFSNSTTANTLNGNTMYSTTNITGSYQGYRFPRFNYANTNARATNPSANDNRNTATSEHGINLSSAIYSYGNYYTWAATKASIADLTTVASSEALNTSICPSGWRLPYGRATGSGAESAGFYYLASALGATTSSAASSKIWRSYPNNFIYSGYISGSTVSSRGSNSYLWSTTTSSATSAYYFRFSATTVLHTTSNRYSGYTVRCVRVPTHTITLDGNGATNTPTASTTVVTSAATIDTIATLPEKSDTTSTHTVSGFFKSNGNHASNVTISSTSTLNSTATVSHTFNGWYKEADTINKIASNAASPTLQANTDYTNSNGRWTYNGDVTLYAGFTSSAGTYSSVTLPTITKTGGFTCGWTTSSTGATDFTYASGASLVPSANITLYGVCKCPANKICYDQNASSGVEGTMGGQTIGSSATSYLLMASNYSRSGYGFAGWGTNSDGTGTNYGTQETIAFTAGQYSTTGLTLYANWIVSSGTLQNWNGCNDMTATTYNDDTVSANLSDIIALTDIRDNQTYAIAKLTDGNCWMIENLRLDNSATLTTANTNNPLNNGTTVTLKHEYSDTTTYNTLSATSTSWCANNTAECNDQSRLRTDSTASRASNPTSNAAALYSYGNYYNFYSATAGRGTYGLTSGNAEGDICPVGWHLPTGTGSGGFGSLTNSLGGYQSDGVAQTMSSSTTPTGSVMDERLRQFPNNLLYSGYVSSSSYSYRGGRALYWTSTANDASNAYRLTSYSTYVYPGTTSVSKYVGQPARCVASKTLYDTVASMSQGPTGLLADDGVWEYSSRDFGEDSDGVKQDGTKAKIYYYRGILDKTTGSYGSNGDGAAWPNYVILSTSTTNSGLNTTDTCWRIIRTTGSGGVKMIYNGKWTGSTCANATTNAQYTTSQFNGNTQEIARQAIRIGFTHNNTYNNTTSTSAVSVNTLFGSNSDYSVNNANSTANNRVYDFYNANLTGYTPILEPNAGYCNDRMSFTSTSGGTATTSFVPYIAANGTATGTTRVAYYAGYIRNLANESPSLGCTSSRNIVDVYSTDASVGGNGQLRVPAALITADEVTFARSGYYDHDDHSFLRTGSDYWTMTPHSRQTRYAYELYVTAAGIMEKGTGEVNNSKGIRPVVSLIEGTKAVSGSGIATDPWIVNPPSGDYTVHFDANGGSGSMSEQSITYGTATNLTSNTFTSPSANYVFGGWNTKKNGSGTSYSNAQSVTDIASAGQTITLYAQWDCLGGYVCYDDNGANSATTMSKQTIGSSDTSVTFWASNFQRAGYGFAGWNTRADGTGTNYGPNYNLSITAGQHSSKGIKLYANWVAPARNSSNNILTFQTTNLLTTTLKDGTTLASKPNGYVTALKDQRDDEVYAVAKLADGNYWMIENMRIIDVNTLGDTNEALAQAYQNSSVYGNFIGLPNSGNCFREAPCWNNLYHGFSSEGGAIVIGTDNDPYARTPNYNSDNVTNTSSNMTAAYNGTNHIYSVGNYYNWPAAMANTSYYTTETKNTSICPKGWRIPYGGTGTGTGGGNTSGGIYYLAVALGATSNNATSANIWRSYPNNFVQSGAYDLNGISNPTSITQQTSTSRDSTTSYMFSSAPDASRPGNYGPKWVGRPMRCVIISP